MFVISFVFAALLLQAVIYRDLCLDSSWVGDLEVQETLHCSVPVWLPSQKHSRLS